MLLTNHMRNSPVSKFSCRGQKNICASLLKPIFLCLSGRLKLAEYFGNKHFLISTLTQSWSLPSTSQHWFTAFIWDSADTYKMNNTLTHWITECLIRVSGIHRQFRVSSSPNLEVFRLREETGAPRGETLVGTTSKLHSERQQIRVVLLLGHWAIVLPCYVVNGNLILGTCISCLKSTSSLQLKILFWPATLSRSSLTERRLKLQKNVLLNCR